jgi:MoxR-like ATPase
MGELEKSTRFERSAARFRAFFEELRQVFVEREDVLDQIALGLLGREHVLLTGPPGTAKSQLTRAVLGRILDAQTGEPSLYARQFTESTVFTDLVGAIDFKTLMETGRSEHFTDEGILGSVHAFLDEVFDGRDMLLRATLNLLGEREMKQGRRTTSGRVECAIMTTNRYLAEVLESSHDSLLAFVDRIAFVGFVPKGFASAESMQKVMRQSLGNDVRSLRAYLTVQDLDNLQEMVDRVDVPALACDRLVSFLGILEREMANAVRSIPDFQPSRYLSIRTQVRAGKALKSIVVRRKLFRDPARPLQVTLDDFQDLYLALLLSGPPKGLLERLLDEQDPREARQLKIVQTERDVFERSLGQLDKTPWNVCVAPAPRVSVTEALGDKSLEEMLEMLQRSPELQSIDSLRKTILGQVIQQGIDVEVGSSTNLERITQLAERVEAVLGPTEPLVRWLRARSLSLIETLVERTAYTVERLGESSQKRTLETTVDALRPIVQGISVYVEEAMRLRESAPRMSLDGIVKHLEVIAAAMTNRLYEALYGEVRAAFPESSVEVSEAQVAAGLVQLKRSLDALQEFAALDHPSSLRGAFDGATHPRIAAGPRAGASAARGSTSRRLSTDLRPALGCIDRGPRRALAVLRASPRDRTRLRRRPGQACVLELGC